jgi:hopanoid-associated phosphorylase
LSTVGVVAALGAEARALGRARPHRAASASFGNLAFLSDGSLVAVSGMGGAAASAAARALLDSGVSALMTFGLAGGLDPSLACGSILMPEQILSGAERFATTSAWRERLILRLDAQRVSRGALLSVPAPVAQATDKARLFRDTGALGLDMESAAVAALAAREGLPFICIRVVVDTAADSLPACVVAASEAGRVRSAALLAGLLRSPAQIGALILLARRYRRAIAALRAIAHSGSLAPRDTEALH